MIQKVAAAVLVTACLVSIATAVPQDAPQPRRARGRMIPVSRVIAQPLRLTILYDNYPGVDGTTADWGFSCLVEGRGETILFDTGARGSILLNNMDVLGADPSRIGRVVISHDHGDHTGGLAAIAAHVDDATVHLLESFSPSLTATVRSAGSQPLASDDPHSVGPGVHTTGALGTAIPEQALAIETTQGLVVITGCAHPGIVNMVEAARDLYGDEVHMVLGGFHLGASPRTAVQSIIADLRDLGVDRVGASHCTGDEAIELFRDEYGEDFVELGCGRVITVGNSTGKRLPGAVPSHRGAREPVRAALIQPRR